MSIYPAKVRKSNTYETQVEGTRSDGGAAPPIIEKRHIDVMFTSDDTGESLSLRCGDVMYLVPFEPVNELIKYTRNKRK